MTIAPLLLSVLGVGIGVVLLWLVTDDDYNEGDCDLTLSVTEWIAKEKGLS